MSTSPPQVIPRKPSGIKVLTPLQEQYRPGVLPIITDAGKENGVSGKTSHIPLMTADREVEIMNHCFDDMERFMIRLQQTAEAQSILNQRTKKSGKKSNKNEKGDNLLTKKAIPPPELEFVDIFQKMKYSFCLLDRLKSSISQPDAPDLLHHIFVPLRLMVKTTGGPTLGASVESPAMTRGAVSLLQAHLTEEEKELWRSLGPNWTSHSLERTVSAPPYSPVFLDGWQPQAYDSASQLIEDPVQLQHKEDAFNESRQKQSQQEHAHPAAKNYGEGTENVNAGEYELHYSAGSAFSVDPRKPLYYTTLTFQIQANINDVVKTQLGVKGGKQKNENRLPPNGERMYYCSYDFVARNSHELSVLHGETLEVLDASKRWWRCQNTYHEIGLVPSTILEPLSAVNNTERDHPALRTESKKVALIPQTKSFSYAASRTDGFSRTATSPADRAKSMMLPSNIMSRENDRVLVMNDELLQRLAKKRNLIDQMEIPSTAGNSVPLNYHSPSAEVKAWLTAKGFSQRTGQSLGVLNAAQLFSLNNEELCRVCPLEGESVYMQILGQKSLLEDVHKVSELEMVREK